MKYLLLSLSFFLFIGGAQAQLATATKTSCEKKVTASSLLDLSLDLFSSKKEATNCKTTSANCSTTAVNTQKVASKTIDCNPKNCNPANCKPENCPPGCKPSSPECKMAVATVAEASPTPDE